MRSHRGVRSASVSLWLVLQFAAGRCLLRNTLIVLIGILVSVSSAFSQTKLSVHWEELTAGDFRSAIQQSQGTCLLPFGIIEKHGPHLPLGTDLLNVRYVSLQA